MDLLEAVQHRSGLAHLKFTDAKARLSALMTEAVHEHRPFVVERQGDPDEVVGLRAHELQDILAAKYRFDPELTFEEDEVVAALPDMGLLAAGPDIEAAIEGLASELVDYAKRYFSRVRFYEETSRASHKPYLLRVALMSPDRLGQMLLDDSSILHGLTAELRTPATSTA
jgi:hypothetical protein